MYQQESLEIKRSLFFDIHLVYAPILKSHANLWRSS